MKRRTEAIAEIDGIKIFWDAPGTPYWNRETDSVHLPPVPDHQITDEDIVWVRGYIDHEKRHSFYSKQVTVDRLEMFRIDPNFHQMANLLEDVRIEQKSGRSGEKVNLVKLRSALAIKVSEFMEKNTVSPIASAVTAFAYRVHGLPFTISAEAEVAYTKYTPDFDAVVKATSYNKVIDIAKKIYDAAKGEDFTPPPGTGGMHIEKKRKLKGDVIGKSSAGTAEGGDNFDEGEDGEPSDGEGENTEDSSVDLEEGDGNSEGDGSDSCGNPEEKKKKSSSNSSANSKGESIDPAGEGAEHGAGNNFKTSGDEKDQTEVEMEDEELYKLSDIEDAAAKEISKIKIDKSESKNYTSYTLGDVFINYDYLPEMNFERQYNIESCINVNTRMITKNLVKILKSKTDTYRKYGERKGKRIAKNRIAGFAMGLNDAPFYVDINTEQIHAKVMILVDLSSSMQRHVVKASAFSYIIAKALGQLNIDFEVLGFYNIGMADSRIWQNQHAKASANYNSPYPKIYEVYHSFGKKFKNDTYVNVSNQIVANWYSAHRKIAPYFDVNSGAGARTKQNEDGEHVYEGAIRLLKNSVREDKKIMFVISDGAPCSEQVHVHSISSRYESCSDYLVKVIEKIRKSTDIDIFGFGFNGAEDIGTYYGEENSIYIPDFNDNFEKVFVSELKSKLEGAMS